MYIHDRDALPGTQIFTEMITAMEKSRKIILVLSNFYLMSQQCKGQADLAGESNVITDVLRSPRCKGQADFVKEDF